MKKSYIFLSVFIIIAIAVLVYFFIQKNKQYDLVAPKMGPIKEVIYGLGTIKSQDQFSFKIAVPKTIQELYVIEGSEVKKGQRLLKFNDDMVVISPFDGIVANLPYHAGENVFTDRPVVEIENPSQLYAEAVIDQQSSMRVNKSDEVRLSFETIENKFFMGKVVSLYHSNGQFIVRVELPILPKQILPGMTTDIAIEIAKKESALLIPVRAVLLGSVLIDRNGQRQKVSVRLGIMDQEWAEVLSDTIKPTDFILIKRAL